MRLNSSTAITPLIFTFIWRQSYCDIYFTKQSFTNLPESSSSSWTYLLYLHSVRMLSLRKFSSFCLKFLTTQPINISQSQLSRKTLQINRLSFKRSCSEIKQCLTSSCTSCATIRYWSNVKPWRVYFRQSQFSILQCNYRPFLIIIQMTDPMMLQAEMANFRQRIDLLQTQLLKAGPSKSSLTKENDSVRGNQGMDHSTNRTLQEENKKLRTIVQNLLSQIQLLGLQPSIPNSLRQSLSMMSRTTGTQRRTQKKKREIFNSQKMRLKHFGMQQTLGMSRRKLNSNWRSMSQSLRQRMTQNRVNKRRQATTWGQVPQ